MSKQLYEDGDVIQAGANTLEVTGVTYQEVDGEKQNFSYSVRLKSELDTERREEAEAQKAAEVQAKEAAKLTPVSANEQPLEAAQAESEGV
jgi:hypothetical protein